MVDKLKFVLALALVIGGLVGYYALAEFPAIARVGSVLAGLALGAAVAWFTEPGRQFYAYSQESLAEARKVVWPTRKETIQTTLVVFAMVVTMGIFLWVVDFSLFYVIQSLLGRGD